MCGLAGIISTAKPIKQQRIQQAVSCLQHRGPDQENVWMNAEATVCFGHRRLSIIDLSTNASQPLHYAGRYTIIHNGEVYNYKEIRENLRHLGCVFHSKSDTEVIVAAYSVFGANCLQQFDGMFAFCIWDDEEKTLFAARDRFGEKPFYFHKDDEEMTFASETKALWQLGVAKTVNRSMLYNFLTIGYTSNPADPKETFYQDVIRLPAASYLLYHQRSGEVELRQYWQLHNHADLNVTDATAISRFQELLSGSVRTRLRSDVPVGTSLSGGLDSSTIVALCEAAAATNYSHHCFTAVFPGFEKNEAGFAKKVAAQFQLTHHEVFIDDHEVAKLMEKTSRQQDEPVSSASALVQYKVYEAARASGIKVLLDGQGADEILAGYHKYYHWYWQELYRRNLLGKSKELEHARKLGIREKFSITNRLTAMLPEFASAMKQTLLSRKSMHAPYLHRDFAAEEKRNLYYSLPTHHTLNGVLHFNTTTIGLEELLRLADRNSMAHGVEVRLPFLHHELVSFLFSLSPNVKIRNGWSKWILREAMKDKLPDDIVWRKDKTGFEPPQKRWMQLKEVEDVIYAGKEKLVKEKILSPDVLRKNQPHDSYAADGREWRYWSASEC